MNLLNRFKFPAIVGVLLGIVAVSCTEEVTTIGSGVIGNEAFITDMESFDVFAFNKNIVAVPTNQLPVYQLGVLNDPVYGRTEARVTSQLQLSTTNPTFGINTQAQEDNPGSTSTTQIPENETVKEVFLYIPYQSNMRDTDMDGVVDALDTAPFDPTNDSDGDGISNIQEDINNTNPLDRDTDGDGIADDVDDSTFGDRFAERFRLDSIYGNREIPFNLKVERSNFFLRDLDPNTNFQEMQEYFSNQDFTPFLGEVLFDGPVTIDDEEILFVVTEDDPDTDEDEMGTISRKLPPGIRVPLDPAFFQENILDKEGDSELLSRANFSEFFRGIHLSVTPAQNEQLMLLLDLTQANITITYEFDRFNNNATVNDTSDDTIDREERDFALQLLTLNQNIVAGNAVNTFINDDYPAEIVNSLDTQENASRLFLKGSAGTFVELDLFDADKGAGDEIIRQIRANNWIINEANLVFHIDRETLDTAGDVIEPPRLYLYNAENNAIIYNPNTEVIDQNAANPLFGFFLNFDGIIEETNDRGTTYTMRITDHINNIIVRDSTNATLGLVLTPDVRISGSVNAMLIDGERSISAAPTLSPLGTVLFGNNIPESDDRRLKLEIFFTESN